MDLVKVAEMLAELLEKIQAKEMEVLEQKRQVAILQAKIQTIEDAALLEGMINGKNAEVRAAELRKLTGSDRELLIDLEYRLGYEKILLQTLHFQFKVERGLLAASGRDANGE